MAHNNPLLFNLSNNFVNETTIALKKRKRKENLKNWKWEDVIVIDDVDVPNKVALYPMFDEEEDEDEAENKNPWEVDDEVADEDEVDDENEVDDEDDWI
ncbi:hypothetical protein Tco_1132696 [Tanacetum coccineum]|uniref:Uncharacterized protein n=1 Tax=Tanacetum coccineum TaxID=301880 RepID=A0ABQ5JE30_9ASTR